MANENETVEQICERLKVLGPFAFKSGNVVGEILAAHNREILVERHLADDHIFSLLEKIDARDALIAELAEALHGMEEVLQKVRKSAWWMDARFDEIMAVNNVMTKADAAFAKAQEVIAKSATPTEATRG